MNIPPPSAQHTNSAGFDRFDIIIWRPLPQYASARLGEMILGNTCLPNDTTHDDFSTLGSMYLGFAILGKEPQFSAWQSIIAPVTAITFQRGVEANLISSIGNVGSMSVEIYNDLDPRAAYLYRGTPIALIDKHTDKVLFQGIIASSAVTPGKTGTYRVHLEAVDVISKIAEIHKYQETSSHPRPWYEVVEVLLRGFEVDIQSRADAPKIGNIIRESSLVEYLDLIANTAGIHWYATRDNKIRFSSFLSRQTSAVLSTEYFENADNCLYLTDAQAEFDTSKLVTAVDISNSIGLKNESGDWESQTTDYEVQNAERVAQYGLNKLSLETVTPEVSAIKARLAEKLEATRPNQLVTSATIAVDEDVPNYQQIMTRALNLDLFDRVKSIFRNATEPAYITNIRAELTPRTFTITYNLTQA